MMDSKQIIALQTWWKEELGKITRKVLAEEEKRQERARKKSERMLGNFDIERRQDIDELYAYGTITDRQREKLIDLWEMRQEPDEMYQAKIDLLQDLYQEAREIIREQEVMLHE